MSAPYGVIQMQELLDVLQDYPTALVSPTVEVVDGEEGVSRLTLVIRPGRNVLEGVSLLHDLQVLEDVASVRGVAERYDIAPAEVEPMVRRIKP